MPAGLISTRLRKLILAQMRAARVPLTVGRLHKVLKYDPLTGIFTWLDWRPGGKRVPGNVAGSLANGYVVICIDGQIYRANRLALLFTDGVWPTGDADHINRHKADNRHRNLRDATRKENVANSPSRKGQKLSPEARAKLSAGWMRRQTRKAICSALRELKVESVAIHVLPKGRVP